MQTIYFETTHFIRHTGNLVDLTEYRRKLEQIRQEEQGETESTAGQAATEYPAPRRRADYLRDPRAFGRDLRDARWKTAFLRRALPLPLPWDKVYAALKHRQNG